MPFIRDNELVVTVNEIIETGCTSKAALMKSLDRYKNKSYGIKRANRSCFNNISLILFYSMNIEWQNKIGDPTKVNHILERYYQTDKGAVEFYSTYKFENDGTYLDQQYQERYIINSSLLKAVILLRTDRITEKISKGGKLTGISKSLWMDAISFNEVLLLKFNESHTLPANERVFKNTLKAFETNGYLSLISAKHKNKNSKKVTDQTLELLNSLFATQFNKPTATEVSKQYDLFIKESIEVINDSTGEVYNTKEFTGLSSSTIKKYLSQWKSKIATHQKRSGDRQVYMGKFKPSHSFKAPEFAGSIISIDDRQPPFKMPDGNRPWFYNGIDLASEAFICWVHGKSKEGIILEFYTQLVRNFALWGLNIPAELECEMSLNSSFTNTFLRPGAMFEHVKIEANNARGKRIERYFGNLRYDIEKKREGWLARPKALKESNQAGPKEPKRIPYETIINGCLKDIENWNNTPHSKYPHLTRWEVFTTMQNPNLRPTNWKGILPFIGKETKTSVNTGIIRLNNSYCILGENNAMAKGESLIKLMNQVEGENITVYWLDDNDGKIIKALIYLGTRFVCEAIEKPAPQRSKIEQTEKDIKAYQEFAAYVTTIEHFGRAQRNLIDKVTIIDNTPSLRKTFVMPGLHKSKETKPELEAELIQLHDEIQPPAKWKPRLLKDRFA
jgi:hypothetical protein